MTDSIEAIRREVSLHESNKALREQGFEPLFAAGEEARIVIIGQAPGKRTQQSGVAWDDASGIRLKQWLGIDDAVFRDTSKVAQIPMDFYYPGRGKSGDKPPRPGFAPMWHQRLLDLMPKLSLYVLVGTYAQRYYLGARVKGNLTQTVQAFAEYAPRYFPIVHPSPLNFRWLTRNPWFEKELVPKLQERVAEVLGQSE